MSTFLTDAKPQPMNYNKMLFMYLQSQERRQLSHMMLNCPEFVVDAMIENTGFESSTRNSMYAR